MRIILNSDVLHMTRSLAAGLAHHINEFCQEASQSDAVLVLPRTVILENERSQRLLYEEVTAGIEAARSTLTKWGVTVPEFNSEDLVRSVRLEEALRETGVKVEVEDPTLDDYRDAERRASLHLAPQSPKAEADEMRDLVIWALALRVAARDGTAILVSRDRVHSDESGSEEASSVRLLRAKDFDNALEHLGRVSKAVSSLRSLLTPIWSEWRKASPMLSQDVPTRRFSNLEFRVDASGYLSSRFSFEFSTQQGKLCGAAHIFQSGLSDIEADFERLTLDGEPWETGKLSLQVRGQLPKSTISVSDRLTELRNMIEGKQ
jgi:hypothetical protein